LVLNFLALDAEANAMANISRPFQIALAAVVLLAGVWLFALQGHSQSSSQGGSGSSPAASQQPSAQSTTVYHGSAPGVAGLTGDIAKAKGAVSTSQQNAHELEAKSAAASSTGGTSADATSHAASGPANVSASAPSKTSASAPSVATTHAPSAASSHASAPATAKHSVATAHAVKPSTIAAASRQKQVEAALASGNVVVVLFWNKKGADDVADAAAVHALKGSARTTVMLATAGEVAAFGSVTRGVQVFGTPTMLVVGKSGKTNVLTGLTDVFALRQAVAEARHP
jgi:hypothetical protein